MKVYLIGYDLNSPGKNYQTLIEEIKTLGSTWWHHLDSTWLVMTALNAKQIRDRLGNHLDSNDEMFVAELRGEVAWRGFNDAGSKWLLDVFSGVPG